MLDGTENVFRVLPQLTVAEEQRCQVPFRGLEHPGTRLLGGLCSGWGKVNSVQAEEVPGGAGRIGFHRNQVG